MSFQAKHDGHCAECNEAIYKDDLLEWVNGQVVHADCVPDTVKEEAPRPTCPKCWQVIAVNGTCGCDE